MSTLLGSISAPNLSGKIKINYLFMKLTETMRWYGPDDIVTLSYIKQAGCTGVVTALHHIPIGEVWSLDEVRKRKEEIESSGLSWQVVESLPVHEDIKKGNGQYQHYIKAYKNSLENLASCGIKVITYNFMPVLDWMRTDLKYALPSGALALRFEKRAFIAFDLFLLNRNNALYSYTKEEISQAEEYFEALSIEDKKQLMASCLQGLPGSKEQFTAGQVTELLDGYKGITKEVLRVNLIYFLNEITPVADTCGIQMAIHPDDPPMSILGLPRIMSTEADAQFILDKVRAKSNGLCFCSGSYGARADNDLTGMIERLGHRIYFFHLRSVQRDENSNFYEANHLEGSAGMPKLMNAIVNLMKVENRPIPMRPDHGHQILDDQSKDFYPGYSAIGRLKGLAELRGLEAGINMMLEDKG